jgi:transposase
MKKSIVFVGLDVHKDSIVVATARIGNSAAVVGDTLTHDVPKLVKRLTRIAEPAQLRVCYEAGPTGYELARRLKAAGIACVVIAPSLIPVQAGRRIKTDRRDAARLASLYRAGELTEVTIPEPHVEAMRDLERARDDAKRDERVARQRLDKFLLRHSRFWTDGTKWTRKHLTWIRSQTFEHLAQTRTLASYLTALDQASGRVEQLTNDIEELVETWALGPLVKALQALRGVQVVTAVTLAAEIGDFARFCRPRQLMSYVGLVPSEHSSGARRQQGGITKTGNKHLRRIVVETAWNYRFRPRQSKSIEARRTKVSPEVRAIAEKAERRLCRRFERLQQKGKLSKQVVTAVARELLGFVWAIAKEEKLLAA